MTTQDREWLRWSLVFVWVSTALVSLATRIQPELWLHPLDPLTKNLPFAAMLAVFALMVFKPSFT